MFLEAQMDEGIETNCHQYNPGKHIHICKYFLHSDWLLIIILEVMLTVQMAIIWKKQSYYMASDKASKQ